MVPVFGAFLESAATWRPEGSATASRPPSHYYYCSYINSLYLNESCPLSTPISRLRGMAMWFSFNLCVLLISLCLSPSIISSIAEPAITSNHLQTIAIPDLQSSDTVVQPLQSNFAKNSSILVRTADIVANFVRRCPVFVQGDRIWSQ